MRGAGERAGGGHRQVDRVSDVNCDGLFCVHCYFKMSFLFFMIFIGILEGGVERGFFPMIFIGILEGC